MLDQLTQRAEDAASHAAKTAAMGAGAAIALVIGLFFLTLSAWLFLITVTSAAVAALIIGSLYAGGGFLLLTAISVKSRKRQRRLEREAALRAAAASQGGLTEIIVAFVSGITAGRKARS